MRVEIGSLGLELLVEKAVRLDDGTLVVADIHLGKATAFQAKGIAIPEGDSASDLARLTALCRRKDATRLVINGDLFHSRGGLTRDIATMLDEWLAELALPVELVIGNHDAKLARLPGNLNAVARTEHAGFQIVHDPVEARSGQPGIAAHWHPWARVGDGKGPSLRLPAFVLRGATLVLPAFGAFTGGGRIRPELGDRWFVSPGGKVTEVPEKLLR